MSRRSPSLVYVIGSSDGDQKIGMSGDLKARIMNLQRGQQRCLQLVASFDCTQTDARLVETTAHKLLSDKRTQGEWFAVTPEQAVAAVRHAIALIESGSIPPRVLRAVGNPGPTVPPPSPSDFLAIRKRHGLTQAGAAAMIGVDIRSWQNWESGQSAIGPSRVLIRLLNKHPDCAVFLLADDTAGKLKPPTQEKTT